MRLLIVFHMETFQEKVKNYGFVSFASRGSDAVVEYNVKEANV